MDPRFNLIKTVDVPAVARFVAAEHFNAKVFGMLAGFREFFLSKTEIEVPARTLTVYSLFKGMTDEAIVAELGDRAETALAHFWELLARQPHKDYRALSGALANDCRRNVFYIRGRDGDLLAVAAHADVTGWRVEARSIGHPYAWDAYNYIFACREANPVVNKKAPMERRPWQAAILEVPPVVRWPHQQRLPDVLRQIDTVEIPGVERFVAAQHFTMDSKVVSLSEPGDDFKKLFMGVIEENIPADTLVVWILQTAASDLDIRQTLGKRGRTFLAQIWEMLKAQPHCEPGPLMTDGLFNVFFVVGANGKLCSVFVKSNGDKWYVNADQYSSKWGSEFYVVAH